MESKVPKVIKVIPYKGINDEIFEGTKTKISLFEDRLEYKIKFKQKVRVSRSNDESEEIKEVISHSDEEGFILKENIISVIKYIETEYKEDLEPTIVNYIDICSNANSLTFSVETEEAKDQLYQDLYNWKFNIK